MTYFNEYMEAHHKEGDDWKGRVEVLQKCLTRWLEDNAGGKSVSNGQLCGIILKDQGITSERQLRRKISRDISSCARLPEMKKYIRPGPVVSLYGKQVRSKVWSNPIDTTSSVAGDTHAQHVVDEALKTAGSRVAIEEATAPLTGRSSPTPGERLQDAVGTIEATPALKELMENYRTIRGRAMTLEDIRLAREALDAMEKPLLGAPGEDVKALDTPEISRHPKNGYKPVTCDCCGGKGKVYIKERDSDENN